MAAGGVDGVGEEHGSGQCVHEHAKLPIASWFGAARRREKSWSWLESAH